MENAYVPDSQKSPLVGVCIPTGPFMYAATANSIHCQAIESTYKGIRQIVASLEGFDPAWGRNFATRKLLDANVDFILFIDPDMVFPANAMWRLLDHDLDIVGCDYRRRGPPFDVLGQYNEEMPQEKTGLVERLFLGLGLILMKAHVFKVVEEPWFERKYVKNQLYTEDYTFGKKAFEKGFKTMCDLDLTKEVYHLGHNFVGWEGNVFKQPGGL